jgi:hypothetical protein
VEKIAWGCFSFQKVKEISSAIIAKVSGRRIRRLDNLPDYVVLNENIGFQLLEAFDEVDARKRMDLEYKTYVENSDI